MGRRPVDKTITVNTQSVSWEENMTIDRILQVMHYTFRMLVVKVDGRLIKKNEYATTVVPHGAVVEVIHLISGG